MCRTKKFVDPEREIFRLVRVVVLSAIIAAGFVPAPLFARDGQFFVSPPGGPEGDGSHRTPWNLATALAHPKAVKPGDTIWLRGGVYRGAFTSRLTGAPGAPITVRQYPGERATIDGAGYAKGPTLFVAGAWSTFWGFEVMNSAPERVTTEARMSAVYTRAPHTKFINLIVHDAGVGVGFWHEAVDAELYGNLIYYNGRKGPDRGHGHGIYVKNETGLKRIIDNIVFQNFGVGIHAYSGNAVGLNNLYFEGNIVFNNGEPAGSFTRNILVGGERAVVAEDITLHRNFTYFTPAVGRGENNLGWAGGCQHAQLRENYFAGGVALKLAKCAPTSFAGSTFYGRIAGFTQTQYPANTYYSERPTGVRVVVRANQYEPGRAHIVVYNWDLVEHVQVDVSSVLSVGSSYEVRNVQDYFGEPVMSGTYRGGLLRFPLKRMEVASAIGNPPVKPATTGPEFAVFVLIGRYER